MSSVALVTASACTLTQGYGEALDEFGVERCTNAVDDDFDGLLDCREIACGPYCPPVVAPPAPPVLDCPWPWVSTPLPSGVERCDVPERWPDLVALCAPLVPPAVAVWVAPDGSPGGVGTPARPHASIADAIADAASRGSAVPVWLAAGVYHEHVVISTGGTVTLLSDCQVVLGDDGDDTTPVVEVEPGRRVVLSGLTIESERSTALALHDAAVAEVSTLTVDTGSAVAVSVGPGAEVHTRDVVVTARGGEGAFVAVLQPGSFATLLRTRLTSDARGVSVLGARLRLETSVLEVAELGIEVLGAVATLDATDVRFDGGTTDRLVRATEGAQVTLTRATLRTGYAAVRVDHASGRATLTDVLVEGTRTTVPDDEDPAALAVFSGAILEARRVAVVEPPGTALRSTGADSRFDLSDMLVHRSARSSWGNAASPPAGVTATDGTCVTVRRMRVDGLSWDGIRLADGHACEHVLQDVEVRDHGLAGCGPACTHAARGVAFERGATGWLTGFRVEHVDGCGVWIDGDARPLLRDGSLVRSAMGLCLGAGVDVASHTTTLVFRDNEFDVRLGETSGCLDSISVGCETPFDPGVAP